MCRTGMSDKENIFEEDAKSEISPEAEAFLDEDEHADTHAEHEIKIHAGEQEADVYTEEGREELTVDAQEIKPWEEGFSKGAAGVGHDGVCAHCSKPLGDREEGVVHQEYRGETLAFCSEDCAKSGAPKK